MERLGGEFSEMSRRTGDVLRRINRFTDGPMTRKKMVIIFLVAIFLLLYVGPGLMNWLFVSNSSVSNRNICQKSFLAPFEEAFREYDAYLLREDAATLSSVGHSYVPYVGNGLLGLTLERDAHLNIKLGRTLSLPVYYHPLYILTDTEIEEFTVADYKNGIINRFQCSDIGLRASYQYFAHRTIPSMLIQDISVANPLNKAMKLQWSVPRVSDWSTSVKQTIRLQELGDEEFEIITGMVTLDTENVIAVAVMSKLVSDEIVIKPESTLKLRLVTVVQYSRKIKKSEYAKQKDILEKQVVEEMKKLAAYKDDTDKYKLREKHSRVWQGLWDTGFYISDSKAEGVVNGDRINATIYAILSQVRSYEHEVHIKSTSKSEILKSLAYSGGCYEGHSTLDAYNLWKPLNSLSNLNAVASVWLLTLEKQGCHNLIRAGASGVNQAMVLSFGSLRFSDQHLEYNIHPSKLHRDFLFRRINYGNMTHVNISVIVQEDNKAALFVALDRSDKTYYACDAGCLDPPVQLGPYRKYFPVKLTEPLTAILYVTADKQHMEDLQHAIHVQEVVEAPAHEHHVIAMHKHGYSLGGWNPLFWIAIIAIIVVFHLFLCRIVMNEFYNNGAGYRRLYTKP